MSSLEKFLLLLIIIQLVNKCLVFMESKSLLAYLTLFISIQSTCRILFAYDEF